MRKFISIFITITLAFSFYACKDSEMSNLVMYSPYSTHQLRVGEKDLDIYHSVQKRLEYGEGGSYVICFDQDTSTLWCIIFKNDYKTLSFYDITDGHFKDTPITINFPAKYFGQVSYTLNSYIYVSNNKFLLSSYDTIPGTIDYIQIDINTLEHTFIQIPHSIFPKESWYITGSLGYTHNTIYFERCGYYNFIEKKEYYYEDMLQAPRYHSLENKIIGLDENSMIVIHDLSIDKTIATGIKREIPTYAKYTGEDFYFLDGNDLYYSKDSKNPITSFIRSFGLIWYTKRYWYKHDLETGKEQRIQQHDDQAIILGVIQ